MKNSTLVLLGLIFLGLLIGLSFTGGDTNLLPMARQVSNPQASTLDLTSDKGAQLTILSVLVIGSVVGMGATLYGAVWYLNRQVTLVKQEPAHPFDLLSLSTEGNTLGAALSRNALRLTVTLTVLVLVIALTLIFLL